MPSGSLQNLVDVFFDAFGQLGVDVALSKIETLAVTVHRAMTVHARKYHTLDHVFSFLDPSDPIQSLAALYHDIVYYPVDRGFTPPIDGIISPFVREIAGEIFVAQTRPSADPVFGLTLEVFDLKPGQRLSPDAGLSEFLSALVMNKSLEGMVSSADLLKMTACIEATIPFRGGRDKGESHFDAIEQRLRAINDRHQLALSDDELEAAVKLAVTFGNQDVQNFAEPDVGAFLDNTWKLLPETNVALRSRNIYSISEYRQALQRMENFMTSLRPDMVFSTYKGVPPEDEYRAMVDRARANIDTARDYLRIKLVATGILEALAAVTGGDAPLALFMGGIPREGTPTRRLENFLPDVGVPPWVDQKSAVYRLLESGRVTETSFDLKDSPLSLFLCKSLKPEAISQLLGHAQEMFEDTMPASDFLALVDRPVVAAIAQACSSTVVTRREQLLQYTH